MQLFTQLHNNYYINDKTFEKKYINYLKIYYSNIKYLFILFKT